MSARDKKAAAVKAWLALADHFVRETNALNELFDVCDCPRAPDAASWDCDCGISDTLSAALDDATRRVMRNLWLSDPDFDDDDTGLSADDLHEVDHLVGPETAYPDDMAD